MTGGAKMLMIAESRRGGNRGGRSEMEMRGGMENGIEMGYGGMNEMESRRRRDSRGRFRSENENEMRRYGGQSEIESEMEMRRGGYGGRSEMETDSRGGYGRSEIEYRRGYGNSEMRGEGETRSEMRGFRPYPFPVYEGGESNMNLIGFNANREIETNYRMNATHKPMNEMEHRSSSKTGGGYSSDMSMPMTKEMAEEWTKNMKNEDGSKGPHWKIDQVKQVMTQKGVQYDPWEFFAVMNALYSDYCSVFKKHGVNTVDMYFDLACAWLNDTDAMPNKASLYYENIVKK